MQGDTDQRHIEENGDPTLSQDGSFKDQFRNLLSDEEQNYAEDGQQNAVQNGSFRGSTTSSQDLASSQSNLGQNSEPNKIKFSQNIEHVQGKYFISDMNETRDLQALPAREGKDRNSMNGICLLEQQITDLCGELEIQGQHREDLEMHLKQLTQDTEDFKQEKCGISFQLKQERIQGAKTRNELLESLATVKELESHDTVQHYKEGRTGGDFLQKKRKEGKASFERQMETFSEKGLELSSQWVFMLAERKLKHPHSWMSLMTVYIVSASFLQIMMYSVNNQNLVKVHHMEGTAAAVSSFP
ncbi:A-kinase anchor protein 9 [Tripterygium wilfordii]|uniref:A-kinase anchor protein 9 n=1 Tax=Tripterygium wilfordii TaxID=458696 RepID=A0A7J7CE21_TRIWF|nr:A-kinase anchor protein 9 [Tripterygium wilfordii]